MGECSSWRANESEAEQENRDEERSERRKRGKRRRRRERGGSPLPACTSFISLIKAGAVGDVKNEPKDMGIGDRG